MPMLATPPTSTAEWVALPLFCRWLGRQRRHGSNEHSRHRLVGRQSLRQAISSASHWSIFLVVLEKLTPMPMIFLFLSQYAW